MIYCFTSEAGLPYLCMCNSPSPGQGMICTEERAIPDTGLREHPWVRDPQDAQPLENSN